MRPRRQKAQQALVERRLEFLLWKRWRRERLDALLDGPYGKPTQALLNFFMTATGARKGVWRRLPTHCPASRTTYF